MPNKVIIIADSTIDLNKKYIEENDIKIIPLHVSMFLFKAMKQII